MEDDGDMLRQAVFGANDGLVSTFGLVAGLIGASAPQSVLILANVVNMFASGMSMGLGSYLASKSQSEFNRKLQREELARIRENPEAAKQDVANIFRTHGVPAKQITKHVAAIVDDEKEWLEFLLSEKHGVAESSFPNPIKGGTVMFFVFVLCGLIPIIPLFFLRGMDALIFSAILTAIALFIVGALKQKLTGRSWQSLGMENLLIGAITGVVGFVAGVYTGGLLGPLN